MSIATLPSRVISTADLTSDMQCENCSRAMTVTPNPYFGTGLAIHRHIALCDACGAVAFVPEAETVAAPSMVERMVAHFRGRSRTARA